MRVWVVAGLCVTRATDRQLVQVVACLLLCHIWSLVCIMCLFLLMLKNVPQKVLHTLNVSLFIMYRLDFWRSCTYQLCYWFSLKIERAGIIILPVGSKPATTLQKVESSDSHLTCFSNMLEKKCPNIGPPPAFFPSGIPIVINLPAWGRHQRRGFSATDWDHNTQLCVYVAGIFVFARDDSLVGSKKTSKNAKEIEMSEAFLTVVSSPRRPSEMIIRLVSFCFWNQPLHPQCPLLLVAIGSGCLTSSPLFSLPMHL